MINADFDIMLSVFKDDVFSETNFFLQAEIIRRVMLCKALNDFERMKLIKQYTSDAGTNGNIYGELLKLKKQAVKAGKNNG